MSRVVLVTKQVPWPSDSGGRIREAHVAALFASQVDEVHVLGFGEPPPPSCSVPPGVTVHAFTGSQAVRGTLRARSAATGRWYSGDLAARLRALLRPEDHLHVGFPQMVVNAPSLQRVDSLDLHNVESDLFLQRARRHRRRALRPLLRLEAGRLAAWERRVTATPSVSCVSEQDRRRLRALGVEAVVAPNGTDLPAAVAPLPARQGVVFVGALDWQPNEEGVQWFTSRVWPRVLAARPEARLTLVGRAPSAALRALVAPSVQVDADVPSVGPSYDGSRLAVCPLLAGGGSRLKVLEALAHGRPVVSTTLGAEGLEVLSGRGLILADEPERFADEVAALLGDPDRCAEQGARGRAAVEADWSWPSVLAPLTGSLRDGVAR